MEKYRASIVDAVVEDGKMLFFDNYFQTVSETDLKTKYTEVLYYNTAAKFMACKVLKIKGKYYFFPFELEYILCFDPKKRVLEKVFEKSEALNKGNKEERIYNYFLISEQEVCCVPRQTTQNMIILDVVTQKVTVDCHFMEIVKKESNDAMAIAFPTVIGQKLYSALWRQNKYVIYNIQEKEGKVYSLEDAFDLSGVCENKGKLFISQNTTSEIVEIISGKLHSLSEKTKANQPYSNFYVLNDGSVLLLPRHTDHVLLIDDEVVTRIRLPIKEVKEGPSATLRAVDAGNLVYVFQGGSDDSGNVYVIDKKGKRADAFKVEYLGEAEEKIRSFQLFFDINLNNRKFLIESDKMKLDIFIRSRLFDGE